MKRLLLTGTLFVLAAAGCQTLDKGSEDGVERDWLGREKEVVFETPAKIVAIWTNSVFNEPGQLPVRGLGGRVYFYDAEHHAIPVDGKLSVFLYDDTEGDEQVKQEASKVVHFLPEEVQSNYTPTDFGPSYSFWVPWDAVGGERVMLGVIPVFTDSNGRMVVGDQAGHLLPGAEPVKTEVELQEEVIQASHDVDEPELVPRSTKIKLPESMQQRLKQLPPKKEPRGQWDIRRRTEVSQRPMKSTMRIPTPGDDNTQPPLDSSAEQQSMLQGEIASAADEKAGSSLQRPLTRSSRNPRPAPSSPYVRRLAARAQSLLAPGERLFVPE